MGTDISALHLGQDSCTHQSLPIVTEGARSYRWLPARGDINAERDITDIQVLIETFQTSQTSSAALRLSSRGVCGSPKASKHNGRSEAGVGVAAETCPACMQGQGRTMRSKGRMKQRLASSSVGAQSHRSRRLFRSSNLLYVKCSTAASSDVSSLKPCKRSIGSWRVMLLPCSPGADS